MILLQIYRNALKMRLTRITKLTLMRATASDAYCVNATNILSMKVLLLVYKYRSHANTRLNEFLIILALFFNLFESTFKICTQDALNINIQFVLNLTSFGSEDAWTAIFFCILLHFWLRLRVTYFTYIRRNVRL